LSKWIIALVVWICSSAIGLGLGPVTLGRFGPSPVIEAPETGEIRVISASYGVNCGAHVDNVLDDMKAYCQGMRFCRYRLTGRLRDPKPGCSKTFEAVWACEGRVARFAALIEANAGLGQTCSLNCGAPADTVCR
jgi:hypothetical protein